MKSNSISKSRGPYGMGDVVKPHVLTYSATFHQWLLRGVSASRTLPTICAHRFSVVQVSFHEASGKAGQQSGKSETAVRGESIITLVTAKRSTAPSFPFSPCVASIGAACGRWQFRAGVLRIEGVLLHPEQIDSRCVWFSVSGNPTNQALATGIGLAPI